MSPAIRGALTALALSAAFGCGARSSLELGGGGEGGEAPICVEGETQACGSDVGACKHGSSTCHDGAFGACVGAVGPTIETCNGIDDDCNGTVDDGFHVGEACDGPDADLCSDDVMTCDGCSKGDDNVETCNGIDDDCNGIVDADCTVGDCKPELHVIGSSPSSPSCIDFPVEMGSTGIIEFPCGGGPVTAQIGSVFFVGTVSGGHVVLDGTKYVTGPDNCPWKTSHHIEGDLSAPKLDYWYDEAVVLGPNTPLICWQPCSELGDIAIDWSSSGP